MATEMYECSLNYLKISLMWRGGSIIRYVFL